MDGSSKTHDDAGAFGRSADSPWAIPKQGWKAVLQRTWKETSEDNVGIVAAGVSFYGFLALVPLLGALVLTYGLVAEPRTVVHDVQRLTDVMPADAAKLIGDQLMNVVKTSGSKKGLGVLIALAIALFGARNGAGSIVTALNIAYEEQEDRGFLRVNLLTLAMTAVAVLVAIAGVFAIAALGHLEDLLPHASGVFVVLGKLLSYVLLTLVGAAAAAALYRFGPARRQPRWVWLTPGSVLTALLWLLLTIGFGVYVARFGHYDATYGSLGAVVVLLTWLYLSSYALLFGAELNSELEKQTEVDTTAGVARPLGEREAWAADHVATAPEASVGTETAKPPAPSSSAADLMAARLSARSLRLLGGGKVGFVASALATTGLSILKRRGSLPGSALLLGAAAGLSWLGGEARAGEKAAREADEVAKASRTKNSAPGR